MPALPRDGVGLRSCPTSPGTAGLSEMGPRRSGKGPRALRAQSREQTARRGEQVSLGAGDFFPPTCPDLVMGFNSLPATRFLPALLRGEGPLVPVPATHQFIHEPFSWHTHAHTHTRMQTYKYAHMCAHTRICAHFPGSFFSSQPGSLGAEATARPVAAPSSLTSSWKTPSGESHRPAAAQPLLPFPQENS